VLRLIRLSAGRAKEGPRNLASQTSTLPSFAPRRDDAPVARYRATRAEVRPICFDSRLRVA
jgi:hypothetical protein